MKSSSIKIPFPLQIVLALLLGCIIGFVFKDKAAILGEIGLTIIKILKLLATPLVFFVIVHAISTTDISFKQALRLIGYSMRNAVVAAFISLGLAHFIPVGKFINLEGLSQAMGGGLSNSAPQMVPTLSFSSFVHGLIPKNIFDFLSGNNLITVVLLAILSGSLMRYFCLKASIEKPLEITTKILKGVVKLVPIAVFSVVAKVVGTTGLKYFSVLALFVIIVTLGILIHVFIYYSLILKISLRRSPKEFFKMASAPLFTALGVGSSLATLPVTLPTLQEKMGVSEASATLSACVGTNLNHDGILLYEATAALFIAQVQGIHMNLAQQLHISLVSLLAAVGIAGIPDAGLITLSLVLGAVGLPLTAVPFLLPVDWFIGRLRAFTNVASDMIVALLLDQ